MTRLLVVAIALHNIPEGVAVGVAFGSGDSTAGTALAVAIGAQNVPEGLAVALPLIRIGAKWPKAVLLATATGMLEPLAGTVGAALITLAEPLLPLALAFAGGAMLFVVFGEVVPESQRYGHGRLATRTAMAGFALMMLVDTVLV